MPSQRFGIGRNCRCCADKFAAIVIHVAVPVRTLRQQAELQRKVNRTSFERLWAKATSHGESGEIARSSAGLDLVVFLELT